MALPANGIIVLECGHVFNVNCFNRWIEDHNNCPVCRRPLIQGNRLMPIVVDDASTEPESSDEPTDDEDDEEWLPPVETSEVNECSTDEEIDVVGVDIETAEKPVSNVELAASRKRSLESSDEDDEEPVLRRPRLI